MRRLALTLGMMLMTVSPLLAGARSASGPQLKTSDGRDAPFRVVSAALDPLTYQVYLNVENLGARDIEKATVSGRVLDGERVAGGFLVDLRRIPAWGFGEAMVNLHEAKVENGGTVVLLPLAADFRGDKGEVGSWRADQAWLDEAAKGEGRPLGAQFVDGFWDAPDLGVGCCADCRNTAEGCGINPVPRDPLNCRNLCVSWYQCTYTVIDGECRNVACEVACKDTCC